MGYYYTTEPENAVPPKSCASPKTHTPGSAVKERGHRYYQPETGRWGNRDPIEEGGGICIYCYAFNNAVNMVDRIGLSSSSCVTVQNSVQYSKSGKIPGASWFSYSAGFSATMEDQICNKCCPNGSEVEDHSVTVSASANFSASGGPWGASETLSAGTWRTTFSGWVGVQLDLSISGQASGQFSTDKCNRDGFSGGPFCLEVSGTGGLNVGGNANFEVQRRVGPNDDDYRTIFEYGMGVYGRGECSVKIKRCYDPNSGWGNTQVCRSCRSSINARLPFIGTVTFKGPELAESCFDL